MGNAPAKSPFAPKTIPVMPEIAGVRFACCEAGIKYQGRTDLLLAVLAPGTRVAGTLTQSKTRSAAVDWCHEQLKHGNARALVVNSGNANAFTGQRGRDAVKMTAEAAAAAVGCQPEEVFIASTGVIGEPMDVSQFARLLTEMAQKTQTDDWLGAAQAIMTTDTYPKLATASIAPDGEERGCNINGISKGAGMIAPDMATMLAFAFTDMLVEIDVLRQQVSAAADASFNAITVDGDTSTSDTFLVFATGQAGTGTPRAITSASDARLDCFNQALNAVSFDLAQAIVKDGEGLTKHVTVVVTGAEKDTAARRIGFAIANSPIVKTAIAGEDPNWGRIVMAVGKSGEAADRDQLSIWFGPHRMAAHGECAPDHDEAVAAEYMRNREIEIRVDVGVAQGQATVWTCDLTHDYISINSDYRS
ncbi:MAG: bifunctional glutamate N-acetyltransferase/amino-acid acetyltransferase ArgJ [Pseudomonadota bacterium]